MKVVQVLAGIEVERGGPSYSVPRLNAAVRAAGVDSVLLAGLASGKATPPTDDTVQVFPRIFDALPGARKLELCPGIARRLDDQSNPIDIIHSHGLWRMPNIDAARAARRRGVPMVVSPRGMLSGEALRISPLGKRLFAALGQRRALEGTTCFHATSEAEHDDIRRLGLKAPIAVIPNGVDLPAVPQLGWSRAAGSSPEQRTALFLGRIHPIKGIETLVEAWCRVAPTFPQWRLRIVGPGEPHHIADLKDLIAARVAPRIFMEGALAGEAKLRAFAQADLFVQPSISENFGLTVAESLASRRPVIVTKGAPWAGVVEHQCGWWIDTGQEALAECLSEALATPMYELDAMGARGAAWVSDAFAWEGIGRQMAEVYRWSVGRSPLPDCVRVA